MSVLYYFCCYLVMSKWLPLPHLVTYMAIDVCFCLRAWKAILCVGTKAGLLLLCLFCSCPLSLWKMRLFSTATSEMPLVLWLCKGTKVGSCFSAGTIHSSPVRRGECPFNCAVTFPSLLGSSSAFQRLLAWFLFAQLQIAVGICSASLMTSSLITFEIRLSAKTLPFAVPHSAEAFLGHLQAVLELCCWGCFACWDGVVDCGLCYLDSTWAGSSSMSY